jgi:hypothetical protein
MLAPILALILVAGTPLPKGYTVPDLVQSPDQRYGFTVPSMDALGDDDKARNSLVDLKTGKVITVVDAWTMYDRMNHNDLLAPWWSKDESTVLWQVSGKWCPWALVLIKFKDGKQVWQLNVLTTFQQEILKRSKAAAPARYAAAKKENAGNGEAFPEGFTVDVEVTGAPDLEQSAKTPLTFPLKVRTSLTANPKGLDFPANLDSELDGVIDADGKITYGHFALLPPPKVED